MSIIRNRLDRIKKEIKPNLKNCNLLAFEYPKHPEKNIYTLWDGIPGSGSKQITKEEFEKLCDQIEHSKVIINRAKPVVIVADVEE